MRNSRYQRRRHLADALDVGVQQQEQPKEEEHAKKWKNYPAGKLRFFFVKVDRMAT